MAREVEDEETINKLRLATRKLIEDVARAIAPAAPLKPVQPAESGAVKPKGG